MELTAGLPAISEKLRNFTIIAFIKKLLYVALMWPFNLHAFFYKKLRNGFGSKEFLMRYWGNWRNKILKHLLKQPSPVPSPNKDCTGLKAWNKKVYGINKINNMIAMYKSRPITVSFFSLESIPKYTREKGYFGVSFLKCFLRSFLVQ